MLDGVTAAVLVGLAMLGAAALAFRLFRSVGRTVLRAAEAAAAQGLADASARRGDLTGMQEGHDRVRRARSSRRRAGLAAAVWLLWLALPLAFGALPLAYALAAPLWLVPESRPTESTPDH
jgi:hypothetical protein